MAELTQAQLAEIHDAAVPAFSVDVPSAAVTLPAALQVDLLPTAEEITHGGFGVVVIGTHTPTNARVAVKKQKEADGIHEATILQQLQGMGPHVNIIGFVGHHIESLLSFLITEAADHEWFDELPSTENGLSLAPLDATRAKFAQALAGVAYMHACGIVHLDLKLENIMVRRDGSLVLIDFGHSQMLPTGSPPPVLTTCKGTDFYKAPGVWRGAYDGVKSDLWSLGICLFAACSGIFPWEQATPSNSRYAEGVRGQAHNLSTVEAIFALYPEDERGYSGSPFPPPLVELLDGLLRINEKTRFTVAEAIASPWVQPHYVPGVTPALPVAAPSPQEVQASAAIHDQAMVSAAAQTLASLAAGGFAPPTVDEQGLVSFSDAGSSDQMSAAGTTMDITMSECTSLSASEPTSPTSPPPAFRSLGHGDSDESLATRAPLSVVRQTARVFLRG